MEKFEGSEHALSREEILALGEGWGVTLPKEFVEFYMATNGGYPPYDAVEGTEYVYAIDWFLPMKYGTITIDKVIADDLKQGVDIQGKIPFAVDATENVFVLSLDASDYGNIYLFAHDDGPEDEPAAHFVCSSFMDFITGLTNEYQDE